MTTNNLPNVTTSPITMTMFNDIILAIKGEFVGRNSSSGSVESGQSLGTVAVPWGAGYFTSLTVGGDPINFDLITTAPNRLVSGQVRLTSALGDFIRPDGVANTAFIEASTTDLVTVINGTEVTFSTDVNIGGLVLAPSSNNTALVNETSYSAQEYTKYAGEQENTLNIDAAGSEWTSRVGQYIAFKVGASTEIAFGFLKSATEIVNCYRGWFFDSSTPAVALARSTLSDGDTLTLLSLGWVYAQNTGTTSTAGYTTPFITGKEPVSPSAGDYWYNTDNTDLDYNEWLIYSGGNFVSANSTLIGLVVSDTSACIASRSFDFDNGFQDALDMSLIVETTEQVRTSNTTPIINVYGNAFDFRYEPFLWDLTLDRDTAIAETVSTTYYLYITEVATPKITTVKPHKRDDLKGFYHPYESWRYVGVMYNDGSSDVIDTTSLSGKYNLNIFESTQGFLFADGVDYKITVIGGGQGGSAGDGGAGGGASIYHSGFLSGFLEYETCTVGAAGAIPGGNGGTSSLGSFITCTGGATTGGTATGGDYNYSGGNNDASYAIGGDSQTQWGGQGGSVTQKGQKYGAGGANNVSGRSEGALGVIVIEEHI